MFCGVGGQLVKNHCHRLRGFCFKRYAWTADLRIAYGVGAISRRTISANDTPRQLLSLSNSCVLAIDLIRCSSPATKPANELLASWV